MDGGNGIFGGGGDVFLYIIYVDGEGGLVINGRGDMIKKGRYFGIGLGEVENVVNEE